MMGIFREWVQNVVVFLLLMTMAGQLIPDEKYKKYIRLTMGLLLILVILLPLSRLTGMEQSVYQNFIRESFRISAADARAGEEIVGAEGQFAEGYKQMIEEEVRLYFEANAMILKYCELDMDSDVNSENYGKIYKMRIGILPKGQEISGADAAEGMAGDIYVGEIRLGEEKTETNASPVPEEKIKQWRQDVSLQFGINVEQLELEILT